MLRSLDLLKWRVFKGVNTHINFPRNTGNILSQEVSFLNFQLHIFYIEALFVV